MLDIIFDESTPIYVQMMKSVMWEIAIGALAPGDKLPSVRDLARQTRSNPNTVQRAYMELERLGVVETLRGQGTYVAADARVVGEVRSEVTNTAVRSFVDEMRRLRYPDDRILGLVADALAGAASPGAASAGATLAGVAPNDGLHEVGRDARAAKVNAPPPPDEGL